MCCYAEAAELMGAVRRMNTQGNPILGRDTLPPEGGYPMDILTQLIGLVTPISLGERESDGRPAQRIAMGLMIICTAPVMRAGPSTNMNS